MNTYHKIQTVFHRDPKTNHKTLLEGVWSEPEFEYLKDLEWVCTEKIDGTNIRIIWDGINVDIRGKTDNAQIPIFLLEHLQKTFTKELMLKYFNDNEVCLYGEGYGQKIQKGGNYLAGSNGFILFDIKIDEWWLKREVIEEIAMDLNIPVVPILGNWTLLEAIEYVKKGFTSTISENKEYIAEGLIMKPKCEMFGRNGKRVVTKIKYKDFKRN